MSNPQQPDRLPSDYELAAWQAVQQFKGRPLSRGMSIAGEQVANGVTALGKRAAKQLENHPRAKSAVSRGQQAVAKGAQKVGAGARGAADALPEWSGTAFQSVRQTVGRAARAGLSSKRVVALHTKRGHDVASLRDVRRLDLEQVDAVRGRAASWYYPAAAALSGASAGLVISGGELVIAASAGAAAAPSGGAIAGAFAADTAAVLGLASRAVGHVSLFYGYDPEEPAEKLFVMSVVNVGTASSATAKNAAMADISRLTQALFRGKAWDVLNDAFVTKVSQQFAKAFGFRLTKKGLGKAVPAFGIVMGGAFNWTTLEGIVDAADMAYRRRFLLDKYPHLADEEKFSAFPDGVQDVPDDADEKISLLDEIAEAGGPDLH
ncbi:MULTISPECIES: EcsC family protein [Streptomyces]|uniref:Serine/arginine repetitive matrix protein 2 n=1 Tax=Streptomyces scabiei (strain 87.22) TaxID=680198 RepID=C9ZD23_STRSW|nr:EcsC family protein [Streptomyces scabiei]KFG10816.1 serine/arginine repetitive matrix protein 2 [Streptomyces scabiei]MDX2532528.1 EcsC family protein [Streptomyces scabiei]MDX2579430.1 EcsC family protein [Streptomyces scabiei]MDX2658224.1 EcsC family protein [Streptomyces scabiei]MDX2725236.1 EcsC family protein [Streptomyces scabiei]